MTSVPVRCKIRTNQKTSREGNAGIPTTAHQRAGIIS
nr:MAG TPA: hypothetical protein [Caudoviricetes sp.]